jgi:tetratricopeptide (TPR) repeat protein
VSYRELRPEPNDPHAPGSTATINEARGNAPDPVGAAERGPEPEPEPEPEPAPIVAVAAAPSPPPTDAPTSASEAQGFGQAQSGAPYDGALAGLETEETADQEEPGEDYAPAYEGVDDYGGDAAADEVYLAEAEQTGSDRLRESENSDDSEFDSGLGHYDSGRYGRASRALGRFLDDSAASDPRRAEARYLLGAALYQQGEYRLAEIELDQFLSANPGHRYAEQAGVLLDDMATRNSPTNRRNAPSEATDLMEAQ